MTEAKVIGILEDILELDAAEILEMEDYKLDKIISGYIKERVKSFTEYTLGDIDRRISQAIEKMKRDNEIEILSIKQSIADIKHKISQNVNGERRWLK